MRQYNFLHLFSIESLVPITWGSSLQDGSLPVMPCIKLKHTQDVTHQPLNVWNSPSCLSKPTLNDFPWALIYIILGKQKPRYSEGHNAGVSIQSFIHSFNKHLWILLFPRDYSRYSGYHKQLDWQKPCCYGVTSFTYHSIVGKTTKKWDEKLKYILYSLIIVNKGKLNLGKCIGNRMGVIIILGRGSRKDILRRWYSNEDIKVGEKGSQSYLAEHDEF